MALAGIDGDASQFSVVFGWHQVVIVYKFSVLAPVSGPLPGKSRHLWGFLPVPVGVLGLLASSGTSLGSLR